MLCYIDLYDSIYCTFVGSLLFLIGSLQKNRGLRFSSPYNEDKSTLGSILGLFFWKLYFFYLSEWENFKLKEAYIHFWEYSRIWYTHEANWRIFEFFLASLFGPAEKFELLIPWCWWLEKRVFGSLQFTIGALNRNLQKAWVR